MYKAFTASSCPLRIFVISPFSIFIIFTNESEHPTANDFVDLSKHKQWAIASPVSIVYNSYTILISQILTIPSESQVDTYWPPIENTASFIVLRCP